MAVEDATVCIGPALQTGVDRLDDCQYVDANGAFDFRRPRGEHRLRASAAGYEPEARRIEIRDDSAELIVELDAAGNHVSGKVLDAGGGSIVGARVTFYEGLELNGQPVATVLSDDQGAYRVALPPGTYQGMASFSGYVSASATVLVTREDHQHDFALRPESIVEGLVVERRSGDPVAGATVTASRSERGGGAQGARRTARTDGDGRFRIRGMRPGAYRIFASGRSMASNPERVTLALAETRSGLRLLMGEAHTISGRVLRAEDSTPLAGARVSVRNERLELVAMSLKPTGKDGRYETPALRPGRYSLYVEDVLPSSRFAADVRVHDRDVRGTDLEVATGVQVRGRVVPAQSARISLDIVRQSLTMRDVVSAVAAPAEVRTRAGDDGTFVLDGVPTGTWNIVATAADGRVGRTRVEVGQRDLDVVVEVERMAALRGVVVDDQGVPQSDIVVRLWPFRAGDSAAQKMYRSLSRTNNTDGTPTDHEGRFEIVGIEPGIYWVTPFDRVGMVGMAGDTDDMSALVEFAAGQQRDDYVLRIDARNGVITGRVLTAGGAPAANATVTATISARSLQSGKLQTMSGAEDEPSVLTDGRGAFEISGLREGFYDLSVDAPGLGSTGAASRVEAGDSVEIVLDANASLTGRVEGGIAPDGECTVRLRGPSMRSKRSDASGCAFELEGLRPGQYEVELSTGTSVGHTSVTLGAGQQGEVQVELEARGTVRGRLVDADSGEPLGGAELIAADGTADVVRQLLGLAGLGAPLERTATDGSFRLESLAPGTVTIVVYAPDWSADPARAARASLAPGETVELGTIEVDRPGQQ